MCFASRPILPEHRGNADEQQFKQVVVNAKGKAPVPCRVLCVEAEIKIAMNLTYICRCSYFLCIFLFARLLLQTCLYIRLYCCLFVCISCLYMYLFIIVGIFKVISGLPAFSCRCVALCFSRSISSSWRACLSSWRRNPYRFIVIIVIIICLFCVGIRVIISSLLELLEWLNIRH